MILLVIPLLAKREFIQIKKLYKIDKRHNQNWPTISGEQSLEIPESEVLLYITSKRGELESPRF